MFKWLMLLFLVPVIFAVSSNDAVNLVVNSGNFLYDGETFSPPNVAIEFSDSDYWVIPIVSGNDVTTYFPVERESGELSASRAVNRGLFELSDNLRNLQLLKESVSSNPGVDWIFSNKYRSIFQEMSVDIGNEVFQLNTAQTTMDREGENFSVRKLTSKLSSMSDSALAVSGMVAEASALENEFVTNPSVNSFEEMMDSFGAVFRGIENLNSDSLEYKSELDKLKQEISLADMDTQTKSQIFGLIEIPQSIQAIRNYNLDAGQIEDSLVSADQASDLKRDSLLNEFENRLNKDRVHDVIYGSNNEIMENSRFSTLTEAYNYITDDSVELNWQNQSALVRLKRNYSDAVNFYGERSFGLAEESAKDAVSDAVSVFKAGEKEPVQSRGITQEQIFLVVGALIVFLIILYAVNNRNKLKGMVQGEEKELDLYE